jgi:hypothetical protein
MTAIFAVTAKTAMKKRTAMKKTVMKKKTAMKTGRSPRNHDITNDRAAAVDEEVTVEATEKRNTLIGSFIMAADIAMVDAVLVIVATGIVSLFHQAAWAFSISSQSGTQRAHYLTGIHLALHFFAGNV